MVNYRILSPDGGDSRDLLQDVALKAAANSGAGTSTGAGARLRLISAGIGLCLFLQAPQAAALQFGGLHVDSAPGEAYSAYIPVVLGRGETLEYLIVDGRAYVQAAGAGVAGAPKMGEVPLEIQLVTSPDPQIRLFAPTALQDPNMRVEVNVRIGDANLTRVYAARAGQPAPQVALLPPVAPTPAASPYSTTPVDPVAADSRPPEQPPAVLSPEPEPTPSAPPPEDPAQRGSPVVEPAMNSPQAESKAASSPGDHRIYIRPNIEGGYEYGGEKLVYVVCRDTTDGSTSTPSLRTGSGLFIGGGAHIRPYRQSPFDLRLGVDYKYQAACNSVSLERFRLTVLPTYRFGRRWWAGAGLRRRGASNSRVPGGYFGVRQSGRRSGCNAASRVVVYRAGLQLPDVLEEWSACKGGQLWSDLVLRL